LDDLPTAVPFDQRRWGNLFFGGLSHYVKTLRDVYRFTTTFDFYSGMFRSTGTMEVNQIDLLGLEALRVFEPDVYDALPEFRRLLLEGPVRSHRGAKKEEIVAELDTLLARARLRQIRPQSNRSSPSFSSRSSGYCKAMASAADSRKGGSAS
jgi:hypothetical protein